MTEFNQTQGLHTTLHGNRDLSFIWTDGPVTVLLGDVRARLAELPAESVQCVVTSPPYWGLRDYRVQGQIGLEDTPALYVEAIVGVFQEVWRVLRTDGTLWLNLGDSYAHGGNGPRDAERWPKQSRSNGGDRIRHAKTGGLFKPKDLIGIPWRVAFALQAAGWYLRADIIWSKPNPMPESVQDRPTKAHEYLFLLTRSERYYYDAEAIREAEAPATAERYEYDFKYRYADAADAKGYRGAFGGKDPKWHQPAGKSHSGDPGPDGHRRLVEHVKAARANGADHDNPLGPGGRNKRTVWTIATQPYSGAHFATFPEALVEPCIRAGSREGDLVLDPFAGSGTTLAVARRLGRRAIGIELQADYLPLIQRRVREAALPLVEVMDGLPEQSFSTLNEVKGA